MFQVSVLASGSKGNSLLVRTQNTALLLDAGISAKRIFAALEDFGIEKEQIQGVLVSHEHTDHCGSAGAVSRLLKKPIFITKDTYWVAKQKLGNLHERLRHFKSGEGFQIGDIICEPFRSSHDAIDSCNFCFYHAENKALKLGVATDLGYPSQLSLARLSLCSTLVLESNHDEQMLLNGPYDWHLKQRVKSIQGHLSNNQAVGLVSQIYHPELKNLVLAHLSETNNHPSLAGSTMQDYLSSIRSEVKLFVAAPDKPTRLIDI